MKVFLKTVNKGEKQIEYLPKAELDHLLCNFFMNVRKANGDEYEPSSLSSFQRSLQRYLIEKIVHLNILTRIICHILPRMLCILIYMHSCIKVVYKLLPSKTFDDSNCSENVANINVLKF